MTPVSSLTCFKAYDVRGKLGVDLDESIAWHIGRAFVQVLGARRVVLGRDCRASSHSLADAVAEGMMAGGADVHDIGLCGTEEVYFATGHLGADGGICVTASHNPMDYNGMKMVQAGSAPLSQENGLARIRALAEGRSYEAAPRRGQRVDASHVRADYVARVLSFIDVAALRPMKILVNAGNGAAGPTFDAIAQALAAQGAPLQFVRLHHEPDGAFPNGIPNPLLPENRPVTADAVQAAGADMGVAWDGDFDRCFLFDADGNFIAGEYVVGLLADVFLTKEPGATIIYDPRIMWNTEDVIAGHHGKGVVSRTGHAFLKQSLRDTGAVYGGEMSAHHYFRDFMCCDSGMIPWLLVAELMGRRGQSLGQLVADRRARFPSSGEINFSVNDPAAAMRAVEEHFAPLAVEIAHLDGLSMAFGDWRFNLRASNTEALLRLNVESYGNPELITRMIAEICYFIK